MSVRVVGGHHQVGMLWKSDTPWLPNNKHTAETRLLPLKRKLKRDENFHSKCREFMENLIQRGYTRKLTEEEAVRRSQRTWYFPHHGVFDPQKEDKIRVVFHAASFHDGFFPNNHLLQGPDYLTVCLVFCCGSDNIQCFFGKRGKLSYSASAIINLSMVSIIDS